MTAKQPCAGGIRVLVAVVAVAVVAVGGLAVAGVGPFAGPAILVVGDSVTNLSRTEIEDTIGAKVYAQNRHTWAQIAPKARGAKTVMDETPDQVGVLLGYNDLLLDEKDLEATRTVLEDFSDVDCVVVLQLPMLFKKDVAAYNRQVQEIVDDFPNTSTDDAWAKVINDNLDDGADMLQADLVHPKDHRTKQALADSYQEAFDRHC